MTYKSNTTKRRGYYKPRKRSCEQVKYYGNLLHGTAQLPSDQVMLSDAVAEATTAPIVHRFAANQQDFFRNFATSMVKMGNIGPLIGTDGEIRKNCRRTNSKGYWKLHFNLIGWRIAMYICVNNHSFISFPHSFVTVRCSPFLFPKIKQMWKYFTCLQLPRRIPANLKQISNDVDRKNLR